MADLKLSVLELPSIGMSGNHQAGSVDLIHEVGNLPGEGQSNAVAGAGTPIVMSADEVGCGPGGIKELHWAARSPKVARAALIFGASESGWP